MSRMRRKIIEKKTLLRRMRKLGVGRHEVRIVSVENVEGKENLIKVTLESIDDKRKGVFIMHIDSCAMDDLIYIIYGDNDEEIFLEDFVNKIVVVVVVKSGRYLNIDYFESLDTNEEEIYYLEEEEEEEEEIDYLEEMIG